MHKRPLSKLITFSRSRITLGAILGLSACFILAETASTSVPQYRITDLGKVDNYNLVKVRSITDDGLISGNLETWYNPEKTNVCFTNKDGQFQLIDPFPTSQGVLNDSGLMNSSHQMVGTVYYDVSDDEIIGHAFLRNADGTIKDLNPSDSVNTLALGINSFGDVVGTILEKAGAFLFIYHDGKLTKKEISLQGFNEYEGAGINDREQIAGTAWNDTGRSAPFICENDGTITNLGSLISTSSESVAINNNGDLLIAAKDGNSFLYTNGELSNLGHLQGVSGSTEAIALNDNGDAVGTIEVSPTNSIGFLYKDGQLLDLRQLVVDGEAWPELIPTAINNKGQIAGSAFLRNGEYEDHLFLLTPID